MSQRHPLDAFRKGDRVRVLEKYLRVDPEAPQSVIGAEGEVVGHYSAGTYPVDIGDAAPGYTNIWLFEPDEIELLAS